MADRSTDRDAAVAAWGRAAGQLEWDRPPAETHRGGAAGGTWFADGSLNVSVSCLDRHLAERADRVAFHWEGEPGDRREITYGDLHVEVCALAGALRSLGVGVGDRVALHVGLIPEAIAAMLACARLGAVHCVLPAALPADALADRIADLQPKVVFTQDGSWRHGVILPLKARADEATAAAGTSVEHTVVIRRTGVDVAWYEGDSWYHELVARHARSSFEPHPVGAGHPLLVCYVADSKGRQTGIVHGTGGFLTYAGAIHLDLLGAAAGEIVWCAVEVAWIGGQSHAIYGPLACGATSVVYEGMLDTPTHRRTWEVIERYGVTRFMTTPSVVRNLARWEDGRPRAGDIASLRLVLTAGEPIEAPLREWLAEITPEDATVADGWGQTELGGVVALTAPRSEWARTPDPGLDVVGPDGRSLGPGERGELVLRHPWPGTYVGVHGDGGTGSARCWECYPGLYATGDWARLEADGSLTLLGRMDPLISVSGQLVSLTEIGEALLEHPFVDAAEVVDFSNRKVGQALAACVMLRNGVAGDAQLARALRTHAHERLGGLAHPYTVAFVEALPAGVPGETLRRALRMICAGQSAEVTWILSAELDAALAIAEHNERRDADGRPAET